MDRQDRDQEVYEPVSEEAPGEGYGKYLEGLGVAQQKVRDYNRRLVLVYLREQGPTLRADLARNLGLSRATVTHIVKDLLTKGLVLEEQEPHFSNGKLTNRIQLNANHGHILGIDLGRSRLRVYLTNLAAEIVDECSEEFNVTVLLDQGLNALALSVQQLVARQPRGWETIRGIGMGIPGSANRDATQIISPPMLKHWKALDIPSRLKTLLGCKPDFPVHLDNDANLGALGESRYGKGRGIKNLIYIKLSSGIGAGLLLNGELYRGERGMAGEFGHIRIQFGQGVSPESQPCASCGEKGCLEVVAGLSAVVKRVQHEAPEVFSSPFSDNEIAPVHMAEVIQAEAQGNAICHAALAEAGERIGAAIGGCLINVYNPALVLLDGGMVRPTRNGRIYFNHVLVEHLKMSARQASLEAAWESTTISNGQLGDNAVGLGAVATVIDNDPKLSISRAI